MSVRRLAAPLASVLTLLTLAVPAQAAPTASPAPATHASSASPSPVAPVATSATPSAPATAPSSTAAAPSVGSTAKPGADPTITVTPNATCDQRSALCSGGLPAVKTVKSAVGAAAQPKVAAAADIDYWGYINKIAPMAVDAMHQFSVPASVTIAQAALESGWGQSQLTIQGHAHFGIKCSDPWSPWQNSCLDFPTQEYSPSQGYYQIHAYFRGYATDRDSIMDHGQFLTDNSRYAPAFSTTNADDFIRAVANAGYATDPNYANSVIAIMQSYNLYMYDAPGWEIQAAYGQLGGGSSWLGGTTTGINCGLVDGGCWQGFDNGTGYWSPYAGTHFIHGAIRARYMQLGNERSPLGYPTSEEICNNGTCYQNFEAGAILWSAATDAWANWGQIRARYAQLGYDGSGLGLPIGPEVCTSSCYQNFQGGAILWSQATGAWANWGQIRARYAALGFDGSPLGLPTGPEVCSYFCYQNFQGGAITWSQWTGAWPTWGAIRARWASLRYETSPLGLPTGSEVCGIKNGGCYQNFEGGAILWSPQTGAWESMSPLRAYYAKNGYETGPLGLPTGPQTTAGDTVLQPYQGGTLRCVGGIYTVG